jgi:DNA-binding MarR family transcriptional regulator
MSSPTKAELAAWRIFLETAWAVIDVLDSDMQEKTGLSFRWYDVLVHLEEATDGLRMNELADRILASKSGLTRIVDNMEKAGLVRRERPPQDRRVVNVLITGEGLERLGAARAVHHAGIQEHFAQHLDRAAPATLTQVLEQVRNHVRPLRPGRVSG